MDESCNEVSIDRITELLGITIAIITCIYELLAIRSRDTRILSPLQLILTGLGNIIYILSGRCVLGRMNKIEPNTRRQLSQQLNNFVDILQNDDNLWIETMRNDEKIFSSIRKKSVHNINILNSLIPNSIS
jgi:hypothetical protein